MLRLDAAGQEGRPGVPAKDVDSGMMAEVGLS